MILNLFAVNSEEIDDDLLARIEHIASRPNIGYIGAHVGVGIEMATEEDFSVALVERGVSRKGDIVEAGISVTGRKNTRDAVTNSQR